MIRRTIVGFVVAVMLSGVIAGGASASGMTVTQAIKAQEKLVLASPAYQSLKGFSNIKTAAQAEKAIPAFRALGKLLTRAGDAVARASATPGQLAGKKDWVAGIRLLAKGIKDLTGALTDIKNGDTSAAKTMALKGAKLANAGDALGSKGAKLLGIKASG